MRSAAARMSQTDRRTANATQWTMHAGARTVRRDDDVSTKTARHPATSLSPSRRGQQSHAKTRNCKQAPHT
jgi:hypothetical protein